MPPNIEIGSKILSRHQEFMTSGTTLAPPDFKDAVLVFRDNLHLAKDKPTKGYINNTGTGITLTEEIRVDNPDGGEWITIFYEKNTV